MFECRECKYYVSAPEGEKPRCSVPIWDGGELYQIRYTKPDACCAMFEESDDQVSSNR